MSNYNYIVDSHCHLDLIEEKGILLDEIILNCQKHNVGILQNICTRITEVDKILSYSKKYDFIYSSVGIHPCYVQNQPIITHQELTRIIDSNDKIIGIGETGLDYFHDLEHKDLQVSSFLEHIKVSQITNLPLIIHSRNADLDMIKILEEQQKIKNFPALLHCFSSSKELAMKAVELGVYISVSGIITFNSAKELRDIIKDIPLELLLVETDSPYLAPSPHRGIVNQPAYTSAVVDSIANLKNVSRDTIISVTTDNFFRIFTRANKL